MINKQQQLEELCRVYNEIHKEIISDTEYFHPLMRESYSEWVPRTIEKVSANIPVLFKIGTMIAALAVEMQREDDLLFGKDLLFFRNGELLIAEQE